MSFIGITLRQDRVVARDSQSFVSLFCFSSCGQSDSGQLYMLAIAEEKELPKTKEPLSRHTRTLVPAATPVTPTRHPHLTCFPSSNFYSKEKKLLLTPPRTTQALFAAKSTKKSFSVRPLSGTLPSHWSKRIRAAVIGSDAKPLTPPLPGLEQTWGPEVHADWKKWNESPPLSLPFF